MDVPKLGESTSLFYDLNLQESTGRPPKNVGANSCGVKVTVGVDLSFPNLLLQLPERLSMTLSLSRMFFFLFTLTDFVSFVYNQRLHKITLQI